MSGKDQTLLHAVRTHFGLQKNGDETEGTIHTFHGEILQVKVGCAGFWREGDWYEWVWLRYDGCQLTIRYTGELELAKAFDNDAKEPVSSTALKLFDAVVRLLQELGTKVPA